MMFKEIHIYDLDGTVIDSTHRYQTKTNSKGETKIDLEYWLNNLHRAGEDTLLPLAEQFKKHIADPTILVIVATARQMHKADWSFIDKHFGRLKIDGFVSRKLGDVSTKGADMKIAGIQNVIRAMDAEGVKTRFFYEDNVEYLNRVSAAIGAKPVFIESKQGY